jgi:TPR repeat protein
MARFEMNSADLAGMLSGQADGQAFYELGMMYASGRSVEPDLVTAHKWFNIAVVRGYREACERRAELAQEMSSAEIAAAQREARLWLTRH